MAAEKGSATLTTVAYEDPKSVPRGVIYALLTNVILVSSNYVTKVNGNTNMKIYTSI